MKVSLLKTYYRMQLVPWGLLYFSEEKSSLFYIGWGNKLCFPESKNAAARIKLFSSKLKLSCSAVTQQLKIFNLHHIFCKKCLTFSFLSATIWSHFQWYKSKQNVSFMTLFPFTPLLHPIWTSYNQRSARWARKTSRNSLCLGKLNKSRTQ